MIEISYLALALLCIGAALCGGVFGLLPGCACAVSGEISRQEE